MSIFSAPKESAFALAAFTAAGLDFNAAFASGDTQVLKKALDAAKAAAPAPAASADIAAAETTLKAAAKENEELTVKLATETQAKAAAVKQATDAAALVKAATTFAGVEATTPEALTNALKAAAGKEGALIVAKAGHPGLEEDVGGKNAATKVKQDGNASAGLTGLAATEAALKARRQK